MERSDFPASAAVFTKLEYLILNHVGGTRWGCKEKCGGQKKQGFVAAFLFPLARRVHKT
jgi:hypothetical protein